MHASGMRMRLLLPFVWALLAPAAVLCEDTIQIGMAIQNWTTKDGLPENFVSAIVRARDGYLWVGTRGGLARFDGVNFETYGPKDGVGQIAVREMMEARDGSLWV